MPWQLRSELVEAAVNLGGRSKTQYCGMYCYLAIMRHLRAARPDEERWALTTANAERWATWFFPGIVGQQRTVNITQMLKKQTPAEEAASNSAGNLLWIGNLSELVVLSDAALIHSRRSGPLFDDG
jgi:hypothetical protein